MFSVVKAVAGSTAAISLSCGINWIIPKIRIIGTMILRDFDILILIYCKGKQPLVNSECTFSVRCVDNWQSIPDLLFFTKIN